MTGPWPFTKLEEVASINPPKPKFAELSDADMVGFIPMAAVDEQSGTVAVLDQRPLGDLRTKSYRTFATNDVIFAKITPCMENGKSAVVPELPNDHGFGSTEFHVIRTGDQVDARYLWRYLRQATFRAEAEHHMTGSVGQLRVPADFLRQTEIPLPSIEEQRQTADLLDKYDRGERVVRSRLEHTHRFLSGFRQSALAAACSGRLTAADRDSGEPPVLDNLKAHAALTSDVAVNKRRTKPAIGLAVPDLSDHFPETWAYLRIRELVALRAILDVQDGNHGELYPRKSDFGESGVPFISAESVWDQVEVASAPRLRDDVAARLRIGFARARDVILTHNATVGRAAMLPEEAPPVVLSTSTTYYRVDERVLLPEYLLLFMRSPFFQEQLSAVMSQTTRNQVPVTKQVELAIAVPSLSEQRAIVRRCDELLGAADDVVSRLGTVQRSIDQASRVVAAKAFRGELLAGAVI